MAELLVREGGKTLEDAIAEITRSTPPLEYYSGLARNVFGRSIVLGPKTMSVLLREPIGVVSIIIPWNAPIALLVRSLAPALAAGNTVVIKPASATSGITAEFMKLVDSISEFPKGTLNFVSGPGETVGRELVRNRSVAMISFTGDTSTGKEIMKLAADSLKKLSLELGGKSPNIVYADADFSKAVKGVITGACFSSAGQVCFAGTRVLIQRNIHERFLDAVHQQVKSMKVGYGMDKDVTVGPIINRKQLDRVMSYIETGKKEAELVAGGNRMTEGNLAKGNFVEPTVFDNVPIDSRLAQEEIFGPVLSVLSFDDMEDAIQLANNTVYGLAAAIWTKDLSKALNTARKVKAGTVWVNTFGRLYASTEAGGMKQSGIGRLYGLEGLRDFTELKNVNIETE
jgi:betaine-aldehyde dehydrogenase